MVGDSLGPYKVLQQLGAGGMGEVYLGGPIAALMTVITLIAIAMASRSEPVGSAIGVPVHLSHGRSLDAGAGTPILNFFELLNR